MTANASSANVGRLPPNFTSTGFVPASSRADIVDRAGTLVNLVEAVLLAARGLQRSIEDGSVSDPEGEALVGLVYIAAAEAHALHAAASGEPPKLRSDLKSCKYQDA